MSKLFSCKYFTSQYWLKPGNASRWLAFFDVMLKKKMKESDEYQWSRLFEKHSSESGSFVYNFAANCIYIAMAKVNLIIQFFDCSEELQLGTLQSMHTIFAVLHLMHQYNKITNNSSSSRKKEEIKNESFLTSALLFAICSTIFLTL